MGVVENLRTIETEMQAFNARDWDRYLQCFADKVVTLEPDEANPIIGRSSLQKRVTSYLAAFPDVKLETERLFGTDEWVCLNSLFVGTHKGNFTGPDGVVIRPTGRTVRVHGCSIFKVVEGQITEFIGYYDQLELLDQLGVKMRPTPG
ncbi:MAG: ester cyclase [Thermoplasmata archaeon]